MLTKIVWIYFLIVHQVYWFREILECPSICIHVSIIKFVNIDINECLKFKTFLYNHNSTKYNIVFKYIVFDFNLLKHKI